MSRHRTDLREVETSPDGRYVRFDEKLGNGAFKEVYLSYDTETGKEVAWNTVEMRRLPSNERRRIRSETEILAELQHPHVISFYHVWENKEKDQICFTTEIVTSGTLKQYTARVKSIKLKVIKKILTALDYLHRHSPPIIHRDLKCDNIFINGGTGEIRLGDFGLSAHRTCTHVASVLGTPEFMAPELYEESYSESVDIYAFGMTLLEMTTKEYPYEECSNAAQIWKKVTAGSKPDVLSRIHDPQVRSFIELCITKDANRLSAAELLAHPFLAFRKSDNFLRDNLVVSVEPRVSSRGNSKPNSGTATQQQQQQQGGGTQAGGGGGAKAEKRETIQQQQQAQQAAALAAAQAQANALFAAQQAAHAAQLAYENGLGHGGGGINGVASPSANSNGLGGHSSIAKQQQQQPRPQTSAVTAAGGPYHPPSDAYPGGGPPSTAPAATGQSTTPSNAGGAAAPATGVSAILVEIESAHGATANIVLHIHLDGGRRKKQVKFALDFRHDTSMSLAGEMVSSLKLPDGERTTMMIASAMESRIDPVRKAYFAQMASESNSPLGSAQGGLETAGTEFSEATMIEHALQQQAIAQQQQQQQQQQLQAQQQALAAQQQHALQQQQQQHTSYSNPNASPSPASQSPGAPANRSIYTPPSGTSSAAAVANPNAGVSSLAAGGRTASTPVPGASTSPAGNPRPLNPAAATGGTPATSPAGTSRPLNAHASSTGLAKPPSGVQHGPVVATALPLHPQPQGQAGAPSQTRLNTAPAGGSTFAAPAPSVTRNLSKENPPVDGVPRAQTPMGTRPPANGRPVTAGPVASQAANSSRGSNPTNMAALAAAATAANSTANASAGSLHHSSTMPAGMHKQQSHGGGDGAFPSMNEMAAQMGQGSQPHGVSSTSAQQRPATAQPHRSSSMLDHSPLPPSAAGSPPPLLTLSDFNSSEDYESYLSSEFKCLSVGVLKERIRSAPGGGELVKACFEKPDLIQMLVRITVHDSSLHPAKPTPPPCVNAGAPPRTAPAGARPHISFSSSSASTPSHSQEPPDFLSPEPAQIHHGSHAPQSPPSANAVPGPSAPSRQSSVAVPAQSSPDPFLGLDAALLSEPVPFSTTAHGAAGADHRLSHNQQYPVVPMRKISSLLDLDPSTLAHQADSARNAPAQQHGGGGGMHHVHHSIDGVYSPNTLATAFSSSANSPSSAGGSVHSRHESTDHERSPGTGQSHASSQPHQQLHDEDVDSAVNSSTFDFQVSVSSPVADPDVGLDAGLDGVHGAEAAGAHQASLDEFLTPHHRTSGGGGGSASAHGHSSHHGLNVNPHSIAVAHHAGSPTEPASAPSNMAPSSSFPYDLLSGSTAPAAAPSKPHHRPSASMDRSRVRIGSSLGGVLEEFAQDDAQAVDSDSLREFEPHDSRATNGHTHRIDDDDHASATNPPSATKSAPRRHTEGPSAYSSRTLPAFASHNASSPPAGSMSHHAHTMGAPLSSSSYAAAAASSNHFSPSSSPSAQPGSGGNGNGGLTSLDSDLFFVKPRTTDLLDPSNVHHLIPGAAALSSHHERLKAQHHSATTLPASLSLGELADMWGSGDGGSQAGVTSLGTKSARSQTTGGGVDTKSFDPFFPSHSLSTYSSHEGTLAPPHTPTIGAGAGTGPLAATKQQRTRSEADQAEAAILQFQL